MNSKHTYNNWEKDFKEFLEAEEVPPPSKLSEKIREAISIRLNPPLWKVFAKLAFAVTIAGSLSLFICPQLGIGFASDSPLMKFFMGLGHLGCSAACGAVFMIVSVLAASMVLRPEELKVLRKNRLLQGFTISGLGIGVFICTNPQILLSIALTWFLGAFVGAVASLELGYWFRVSFIRRQFA